MFLLFVMLFFRRHVVHVVGVVMVGCGSDGFSVLAINIKS